MTPQSWPGPQSTHHTFLLSLQQVWESDLEKKKMRKQRKRATSRLVLFLDGSWVGKMAELSFPSIFSTWA